MHLSAIWVRLTMSSRSPNTWIVPVFGRIFLKRGGETVLARRAGMASETW